MTERIQFAEKNSMQELLNTSLELLPGVGSIHEWDA